MMPGMNSLMRRLETSKAGCYPGLILRIETLPGLGLDGIFFNPIMPSLHGIRNPL